MSAKVSAKIAMYRLNELGDCFLITFKASASTSRLLIDCGSFRNSGASVARLKTVTAEIAKALDGKPLDVVIGTHQHNDHLSGFVHCEEVFRKMNIQQVWLSWLDDPADRKAQSIGQDHHNLRMQLSTASDRLRSHLKGKLAARPAAAQTLEVVEDMLGFFGATAGAAPALPAEGVRILKSIGSQKPLYLKPGRTLEMPGLPSGSVKIHVLGPPRRDDLLFRSNPRAGESYDKALAFATLSAAKFLDAVNRRKDASSSEEEHYPFNRQYKITLRSASSALREMIGRYKQRDEAWRNIDDDWLQQAEGLALFLDTYTNNSSLALAIELVDSGKVLLFAADAQTGNWLSWKEIPWEDKTVKLDDLLARTVFYKVGHHASHNATLVEAFEKMGGDDLVALIPVHKKDPNITKKRGWKMPATNLFRRLTEKTHNRVLQMDDNNPPDCDPTKNPAKASWNAVGIKPRITNLSIEVDIAG